MSDEGEQKEEKEGDEELPSTGTERDLYASDEPYERFSHEYWVYDTRVDVTGPRPPSHVAKVRSSKKKKRKTSRKKVAPRRKKVSTTKKRWRISKDKANRCGRRYD